jgi:hypothetical protein
MKQLFVNTIVFCLLLTSIVPATQADIVSTESALIAEQRMASQARVNEFLLREDVRAEMVQLGVSPERAIERVGALTLTELQSLETRINDAPAGGIAEVIGIVAIVLIVLELLGVTNVFTNF